MSHLLTDLIPTATIVGIDCATTDDKIGIAVGSIENGLPRVAETIRCSKTQGAVAAIVAVLRCPGPHLLALDAPLGWPDDLRTSLVGHRAGEELPVRAELLFKRSTDRFVRDRIGQRPLDVGADRIARTARHAVNLLADLRRLTQMAIPLAWAPLELRETAAIEVYPSATLKAAGIAPLGYKKFFERGGRERLIDALEPHLAIAPSCREALLASADALDAAVCVLAGADFLRGFGMAPEDLGVAKREGWIWVRAPGNSLGG